MKSKVGRPKNEAVLLRQLVATLEASNRWMKEYCDVLMAKRRELDSKIAGLEKDIESYERSQ